MHFQPVLLPSDIFSEAEKSEIFKLVSDIDESKRIYKDDTHKRKIRKITELSEFSSRLVPIARELFNDPTLDSTYSVVLTYGKDSSLTFHKDYNACVYTIDYCVSSNVDWPLVVEDVEFSIPEGRALAFMGGHDMHGRHPMPDIGDPEVINIMFHFCPSDHWYFTEGPGHIKVLAERGEVPSY